MKQTCSYGEKYLAQKKTLVETSLYPCVGQILVTIKALLFAFAFLPIQIKVHVPEDFHTQVL